MLLKAQISGILPATYKLTYDLVAQTAQGLWQHHPICVRISWTILIEQALELSGLMGKRLIPVI